MASFARAWKTLLFKQSCMCERIDKLFIIQNEPEPEALWSYEMNQAQVKRAHNSAGGAMQKRKGGL